MPFRPLNQYLTVRLDAFPAMVGSLHIPERYIERAARTQDGPLITGTVVAVGKGDIGKHGGRIPCGVEPGERIAFPKHGLAPTFHLDGEDLLILHEQFVFGVVTQDAEVRGVKSWSEVGYGKLTSETLTA